MKILKRISNWFIKLFEDDSFKLAQQNVEKLKYAKYELEKLKTLYDLGGQEIPFEHFRQLDLLTPTQVCNGVMATVFYKTQHRIDMIVHYAESSILNFHNHPNATETILHVHGNIDMYINSAKKKIAEEYKFVTISPGDWHKFVSNSDAISVVRLEKLNTKPNKFVEYD